MAELRTPGIQGGGRPGKESLRRPLPWWPSAWVGLRTDGEGRRSLAPDEGPGGVQVSRARPGLVFQLDARGLPVVVSKQGPETSQEEWHSL